VKKAEIQELHDALEDTMAAQDMVEALTERNLSMSERIEELEQSVADFEALQLMSDEMEETITSLNKSLQAQLCTAVASFCGSLIGLFRAVSKDVDIQDLRNALQAQRDVHSDAERTIDNFRVLVRQLQAEVDARRERETELVQVLSLLFMSHNS